MLILFIYFTGCAPLLEELSEKSLNRIYQQGPEFSAPLSEWQEVKTIAVMPPDSWNLEEVNLAYITWFRALINSILEQKEYNVVKINEMNRVLNSHHLHRMADFVALSSDAIERIKKISTIVGADAIIVWEIIKDEDGLVGNINCLRADGKPLWASGKKRFKPLYPYSSYGEVPYLIEDISLTISYALRSFPRRLR